MINTDKTLLFYRASKTLVLLFLGLGRAIPLLLRAWLIYLAWGMWMFAMHSVYILLRTRARAAAA